MQGHSPIVNDPTATTIPIQNNSNEGTCQRWFNNVSAKTHQYFGKFIAVVSAPFKFVPSLARYLYHGAKNLYQRTISKPDIPVHNRVSSCGVEFDTPGAIQSATQGTRPESPILSEPDVMVLPEPPKPVQTPDAPTIERLRMAFPNLNQLLTALEASAEDANQRMACKQQLNDELRVHIKQLEAELACYVQMEKQYSDRIKELQQQIDGILTENCRHIHSMVAAEQKIVQLSTENARLNTIVRQLQVQVNKSQREDDVTVVTAGMAGLGRALDNIFKVYVDPLDPDCSGFTFVDADDDTASTICTEDTTDLACATLEDDLADAAAEPDEEGFVDNDPVLHVMTPGCALLAKGLLAEGLPLGDEPETASPTNSDGFVEILTPGSTSTYGHNKPSIVITLVPESDDNNTDIKESDA